VGRVVSEVLCHFVDGDVFKRILVVGIRFLPVASQERTQHHYVFVGKVRLETLPDSFNYLSGLGDADDHFRF